MADYKDETYRDEVGGLHEGGVGWNPNGIFCGECTAVTCKGCSNEKATGYPFTVWEGNHGKSDV